ncbi:transaldolase family protein [Streptomyces sp. TRM49041]|uniref:transaldolase family protein n=1 Tax=Streptomyces sp. TRM49041 TaxID=2603216 RepID=UPI0011EF8042|nr:transaldolase family protein [Streptomyces sp. TRM49041]
MKRESALVLLQRLAAEGVTPWMDDGGRRRPAGGVPDRLSGSPPPFRGAVIPPSCPAAARHACDALLPVHEASGGRDGHVSAPVDPRAAHDADALTAAAGTLHRAVERPNLLVRIPATPAGLVALADCLAEGIGVDSTLVFCAERYAQVLDAYFTGMERALTAGLPLQPLTCVTSFPVGPLDTEANARLTRPRAAPSECGAAARACVRGEGDGPPGGPAGPVEGVGADYPVALAVARQVFRVREERLAGQWWRVLRAGGAAPPRLLWTEPEHRHIGALIGWNTAIALPPDVLESAPDDLELCGDTLLNSHREGLRTLAALERHGVRMAELADVLESRELARLQHAWKA